MDFSEHPPVTLDDHAHETGPFLHGTRARLEAGAMIETGRVSNFHAGRVMRHVFFTTQEDTAAWGAQLSVAQGETPDEPGHVYLVEPTGPFEDDPNVTDKKFPGNPTRSFRSRSPLRVLGEFEDWQPHPPEALQQMLDNLARLREQGLDVIED